MRVLVTGASGFLGRAIVAAGAQAGHHMIAASRAGTAVPGAAQVQASGDLLAEALALDFSGVDALIHCAARVHVLRREAPGVAEAANQAMNAQLPVRLAMAARESGARRFVQISSVAALASRTPAGATVTDSSPPAPSTPYGRAKRDADAALAAMASGDFATIALRPPALYGPGCEAWFAMLARAARAGVPLPLGAIENRRSFAFVGNVAQAAVASLKPLQSGAFIVTDSLPISTAALYRKLLALAGHGDRVWRWPAPLVRLPAQLVLGERSHSLIGDAAFDGSRFAQTYGWEPPVRMDEALRLTMDAEARKAS